MRQPKDVREPVWPDWPPSSSWRRCCGCESGQAAKHGACENTFRIRKGGRLENAKQKHD